MILSGKKLIIYKLNQIKNFMIMLFMTLATVTFFMLAFIVFC